MWLQTHIQHIRRNGMRQWSHVLDIEAAFIFCTVQKLGRLQDRASWIPYICTHQLTGYIFTKARVLRIANAAILNSSTLWLMMHHAIPFLTNHRVTEMVMAPLTVWGSHTGKLSTENAQRPHAWTPQGKPQPAASPMNHNTQQVPWLRTEWKRK